MLTSEQRLSAISVASGSYIISKGKNRTLIAYLGTCVGVTLCDPKANVGGLIHFLLPEPTCLDDPWDLTIYAATGLPIFIRELCAAGASKERLEACIAGGSLVGPLSGRDLFLDIGGRTAEVVEKILNRENIPVREREIGGYFSCLLSLNLGTWESKIDPLGPPSTASAPSCLQATNPGQLDEAIERILPIPQVALKIMRIVHDNTCALKDLADEIVQDQVISARVLRLCNSLVFRRTARIDSIDKALMRLGDKYIVQIVLATVIEDFLSRPAHGYSLCKGGLFNHALGTARVSRLLAQLTHKTSPDLAYTAGLLHDIGKVVLDQYMCGLSPLFYRRTQVEGMELITAEQELFGITHTEVGKRLAQQWLLPDNLTDTITHHHSPEMAVVDPELCHIVYLADLIMSRFVVAQELERMSSYTLEAALRKIGLGPEQFPYVIDWLSREISCMAHQCNSE